MHTRFLFWNIKNKPSPFEEEIGKLVKENFTDILVIAENDNISPATIEEATKLKHYDYTLIKNKSKPWLHVFYNESKVTLKGINTLVFTDKQVIDKNTTESPELAKYLNKKERLIAYELSTGTKSYLLFVLHFPSKLYCSSIKQGYLAGKMKKYIERIEKQMGLKESIVLGDFNMNPFEEQMVGKDRFNACISTLLANDSSMIYDIDETTFYNPAWALLGDFHSRTDTKRVPGTIFYEDIDDNSIYWQLFDQVIYRPSLDNKFVYSQYEILEGNVLQKNFLNDKQQPDKVSYSDHLPIKFTFNL